MEQAVRVFGRLAEDTFLCYDITILLVHEFRRNVCSVVVVHRRTPRGGRASRLKQSVS